MLNKKYFFIILTAFLCILSCTSGYFIGLNHIRNTIKTPMSEEAIEEKEDVPVLSAVNEITPSTKMVYEYYYIDEGTTKISEETPPYFMLGLTFNDVVKYYTNWDVVSFSPKEVNMRKTVYGSDTQKYIVGEKDGYITVFYEENGIRSDIKEITSINTNGLDSTEKEKLKKGISVIGDYALNRILENYSS